MTRFAFPRPALGLRPHRADRLHGIGWTLLSFVAVLVLVASAMGQTSRVIHLWVDPVHGVDASASTLNPLNQTECGATINRPNDMTDPAQSNAVLLHAPWPFKTITGAIAYLPQQGLPYTSARTGITWAYAIIHLMPGLYCRFQGMNNSNGMIANGETFPIFLPDRVSIQGTSALNTVLDMAAGAHGGWGPMFHFGALGNSGAASTIDNVTITGVLRTREDDPWTYAVAIVCAAMFPGSVASPTITNCFLYGNEVGMAVVSDPDGTLLHEPVIMHNTFAWNRCGLWNGQLPPPAGGSVGISRLLILNNIFDATPPDPQNHCPVPSRWQTFHTVPAQPQSDFEGVDITDMTPSPGLNHNAFELYKSNLTTAFLPGFPATTVRTGFPTPLPTLDISPYTGANQGVRRGVLFVRDLICNGAATGAFRPYSTGGFDLAPHDFRLSPAVAPAGATIVPPGGPGGALNPLVDHGWRGTFPLTMANGLVLNNPPGYLVLPSADQATWPFSSWKGDCDGYGNPRDTDHPMYPNFGVGSNGRFTDVGADELGELTVTGARYQTTIYAKVPRDQVVGYAAMDNRYLWYLGRPAYFGATPANQAKPKYRVMVLGGLPPSGWYPLPPWWSTWAFSQQTPPPYYQPPRVNIMPHLVPDIHPWWQLAAVGVPCNPLWNACSTPLYNPALFMNPLQGIINPPGSYLGYAGGAGANFAWLDGLTFTTPAFLYLGAAGSLGGPWGTNGSDAFTSFDPWCVAVDASGLNTETFLPTYDLSAQQPMTALRFTLEVADRPTWTNNPANPLGSSNMQSILVVVDGPKWGGQ